MNRRRYTGRRYYQVLGVTFLVVVALFLATTIGMYRKAFASVVPVTLKTEHIGTQMSVGADVKARGVIVGEVDAIEASRGHATMRLALQPDKVDMLPADVSARLLPKTLFGERYVALQIPGKAGGGAHLEAGDVIGADRSAAAIEIEEVLGELMPLLQALQPQKLSVTLNAVSQALQGRGEQLGDTLVRLDSYLTELNPSLPKLQEVLGRLDDVSDTYARAAPDALKALSDLTTTTKTVVEQRKQIQGMLDTLTTTSVNTTKFLETNRQNMIHLADTSRSTLELLAKYAPEYPCMLGQIADAIPTAQRVFGKGTEQPHIQKVTIEIADGHHKYVPGLDDPQYLEQRGPRCYEQAQYPDTFPQHPPGGPIKDGSRKSVSSGDDESSSTQQDPAATSSQSAASSAASPANSPAEQRFLAALLAPSLNTAPSDVPEWSSLLVGPLFRGAEVTLQ